MNRYLEPISANSSRNLIKLKLHHVSTARGNVQYTPLIIDQMQKEKVEKQSKLSRSKYSFRFIMKQAISTLTTSTLN